MKGLIKKKLEPCAWLLSADEQAFEVEPLVIQVVPDVRSHVHSTGWYLYGKIWQKPDGMQFICFSEDSFGKREIPLANEEEELPPFGGQNGQVSVRSSGVRGTEVSKMKHRPCKSRTFPTCESSVMLCFLVQKVSTWFRVGWGTRKVTAVRLVVFMCYCSGAAAS